MRSNDGVNGRELHRLSRYLEQLSRQVSLDPGETRTILPSPAEMAVAGDVIENPGSSIREITGRTGFVQSYVSTCITRLAEQAIVATEVDPHDRRRTLVYPTDMILRAIERRTSRSVREILAQVLDDPGAAARAATLLDELAALLLPAQQH